MLVLSPNALVRRPRPRRLATLIVRCNYRGEVSCRESGGTAGPHRQTSGIRGFGDSAKSVGESRGEASAANNRLRIVTGTRLGDAPLAARD